jgi:hypothetical protein
MNCTSFREAVHELDRDDVLDAAVYDSAVEHAQICTRCARLIYQTRRLDSSLRALARADEHREASPRVQTQLLRAFRAHAPARQGGWHALRWAVAAAAVLILAGGAFLVWRRAPAPVRSHPAAHAASGPAASPAPSKTTAMESLASTLRPKAHAGRSARAAKPAAQPEELDDLSEFISLPYADDDAPLGAGELVRVRLSESALGLLGFPVSEETPAQPVTADVVIGEDGVARAIRFVSGAAPSELAQLRAMTPDNKGAKP